MKLSIPSILVTMVVAAAAFPAETYDKKPGFTPVPKRDVEQIAKDPTCYNDVDCEGGYCLNGICLADPPTKRSFNYPSDDDGRSDKRDIDQVAKDPTCHNDVDCEGGICDNGICIVK